MKSDIVLRQATEEDFEFLYRLHRAALKGYIDRTWGWDEDWQADYFRRRFDIAGKSIVQQDGSDIGCVAIIDEGDHLFLSYIALLPEYQRKGIGTRLIEGLIREARRKHVPVTLRVLRSNPARELYERLGFTVYETTETHHLMIAHPLAAEG